MTDKQCDALIEEARRTALESDNPSYWLPDAVFNGEVWTEYKLTASQRRKIRSLVLEFQEPVGD